MSVQMGKFVFCCLLLCRAGDLFFRGQIVREPHVCTHIHTYAHNTHPHIHRQGVKEKNKTLRIIIRLMETLECTKFGNIIKGPINYF